MKPKTIRIIYWTVTILFALAMLMDGIVGVMQVEQGKEIMVHLGYPIYILTILGVAKILGAIGIVQGASRTLKEWAFAGFTFHFLGACASRAFAGDSITLIISPLIFMTVMFVTYFLWKKTEQLKAAETETVLSSRRERVHA
jgi:hypothetical protein